MKSANAQRLAHQGKPVSQARAGVGVGGRTGQGLQGPGVAGPAEPVATQTGWEPREEGRSRVTASEPNEGAPLPACPHGLGR